MCRRSLHFTDLEMYPLNLALEDVLHAGRGRCLSESDASTLGIQVAVSPPTHWDGSCCHLQKSELFRRRPRSNSKTAMLVEREQHTQVGI